VRSQGPQGPVRIPDVKSTKSEVRRAELHVSSVSPERGSSVKRNGLSQRELVCAR